jgi:hypothetical protein
VTGGPLGEVGEFLLVLACVIGLLDRPVRRRGRTARIQPVNPKETT